MVIFPEEFGFVSCQRSFVNCYQRVFFPKRLFFFERFIFCFRIFFKKKTQGLIFSNGFEFFLFSHGV